MAWLIHFFQAMKFQKERNNYIFIPAICVGAGFKID